MASQYFIRSGWGKRYYFSGYEKNSAIPVYQSEIDLARPFTSHKEAAYYACDQLFSSFNFKIEKRAL